MASFFARQTLALPSWANLGELAKLAKAVTHWWLRVQGWLCWPLTQLDAASCDERLLPLLAWERDVQRFVDEDMGLFRLRVQYAIENAKDAGNTAGLKRILDRLNVAYTGIEERAPGFDWDIVRITMTDSQMTNNLELTAKVVQQYGRTCRRYQVAVVDDIGMHLVAYEFDHTSRSFEAVL